MVLCMPLHPFVVGQPHRIAALYDVLQHVTSHKDVWLATAGEIADWYLQHHYDEAVALSGISSGGPIMTNARLTYPHRRRGLDHDWFPSRADAQAAPVSWPEGKPIALWITVPVEFFPLDAPAQPFRPLGGLTAGYPDFWNYSNRDYGARIGIYRIMRVLDGFGLRATAAVNAAAAHTLSPRHRRDGAAQLGVHRPTAFDMGHVHHGASPSTANASLSSRRDTSWSEPPGKPSTAGTRLVVRIRRIR